MADVLMICVRQDVPRAEALAEMFDAAGFSIGDNVQDDAALARCGAAVVVWSRIASHSQGFLSAVSRAMKAGKAVFAIGPGALPPGDAPPSRVFDLADWEGEGDDAILDSLFFTIDRLVMLARAEQAEVDLAEGDAPEAVAASWLAELPAERETRGRGGVREIVLGAPRKARAMMRRPSRVSLQRGGYLAALGVLVLIGGPLTATLAMDAIPPAARIARASTVHAAPVRAAQMETPRIDGSVNFADVALAQAPYEPAIAPVRLPPRHGLEPPSASSLTRAARAPHLSAWPRLHAPRAGFIRTSAIPENAVAPVVFSEDELRSDASGL